MASRPPGRSSGVPERVWRLSGASARVGAVLQGQNEVAGELLGQDLADGDRRAEDGGRSGFWPRKCTGRRPACKRRAAGLGRVRHGCSSLATGACTPQPQYKLSCRQGQNRFASRRLNYIAVRASHEPTADAKPLYARVVSGPPRLPGALRHPWLLHWPELPSALPRSSSCHWLTAPGLSNIFDGRGS